MDINKAHQKRIQAKRLDGISELNEFLREIPVSDLRDVVPIALDGVPVTYLVTYFSDLNDDMNLWIPYPFNVDADPSGGEVTYRTTFLDFPDVVGSGHTLYRAICDGYEKLNDVIKTLRLYNKPVPKPYHRERNYKW